MDRRFVGMLGAGFAGGIAIGLAIMVIGKQPAAAVPVTDVAGRADAVLLPFEPPRFTPLRYEFDMRIERDSGVQNVTATDELVFLPGPSGGYTVRWKTRDYGVEAPPPARALLTRSQRLAKEEPLLLSLTPRGVPQAIINEARVRAVADQQSYRAVSDADFADVPENARAALRKLVAEIETLQRSQSAQAFAEAIMENPRLLLRDVGLLVPGRTVLGRTDVVSRIDGEPVRFTNTAELRRYEPGRSAEIVITSVANADDAKRTMLAMIGPVLDAIPNKAEREAAGARIAEMGDPTISDETVIAVDLPSGLARSMVWRKRLYMPGRGTTVETRSFRRVG